MKKTELEEMIRQIVREEVASELSNAFRYVMKEAFLNYSNKGGIIKEASGNREDYNPYPEVRHTNNVAAMPTPDFNREAFSANYKAMMDSEFNQPGFETAPPVAMLPTTNPDGRPINLHTADKTVISALTKNYSSFMKTLKR